MLPPTLFSLILVAAVAGGALAQRVLRRRDETRWSAPDGQARLRAAGASPTVATLLARGETIGAIKAYRAEHQVSLRDAKAVIDHLIEQPPTDRA